MARETVHFRILGAYTFADRPLLAFLDRPSLMQDRWLSYIWAVHFNPSDRPLWLKTVHFRFDPIRISVNWVRSKWKQIKELLVHPYHEVKCDGVSCSWDEESKTCNCILSPVRGNGLFRIHQALYLDEKLEYEISPIAKIDQPFIFIGFQGEMRNFLINDWFKILVAFSHYHKYNSYCWISSYHHSKLLQAGFRGTDRQSSVTEALSSLVRNGMRAVFLPSRGTQIQSAKEWNDSYCRTAMGYIYPSLGIRKP